MAKFLIAPTTLAVHPLAESNRSDDRPTESELVDRQQGRKESGTRDENLQHVALHVLSAQPTDWPADRPQTASRPYMPHENVSLQRENT